VPPDTAPRAVLRALRSALPLLFSARLLGALALWLGGSILLWLVIGAIVLDPAAHALAPKLGTGIGAQISAALIVMAALALAALLTVVVAIAVFTMPTVVKLVAARRFPALERRHGGTLHGSLVNVAVALCVFVPLWLASFALLALPPVYVAVSWVLTGWLNQRLFRYDALAEHADRGELADLPRALRARLLLLGVVLAPLALVPIANLFLPLLAALAFACLCLDGLARARGQAPS
jgi:hypothetical protein